LHATNHNDCTHKEPELKEEGIEADKLLELISWIIELKISYLNRKAAVANAFVVADHCCREVGQPENVKNSQIPSYK
jgi:hypothetical protein